MVLLLSWWGRLRVIHGNLRTGKCSRIGMEAFWKEIMCFPSLNRQKCSKGQSVTSSKQSSQWTPQPYQQDRGASSGTAEHRQRWGPEATVRRCTVRWRRITASGIAFLFGNGVCLPLGTTCSINPPCPTMPAYCDTRNRKNKRQFMLFSIYFNEYWTWWKKGRNLFLFACTT